MWNMWLGFSETSHRAALRQVPLVERNAALTLLSYGRYRFLNGLLSSNLGLLAPRPLQPWACGEKRQTRLALGLRSSLPSRDRFSRRPLGCRSL